MTNRDKSIYLERQRVRYRELKKRDLKTDLIEEVSVFLGITRAHAIRCLNGRSRVPGKRPGPKRRYGADELPHLKRLYHLLGQPCSKRYKIALQEWLIPSRSGSTIPVAPTASLISHPIKRKESTEGIRVTEELRSKK